VYRDLDSQTLADHEHLTRLQRHRDAMNPEMKLLLEEFDKRFAT
jgi:hypothetical protein